MRTTVDIPDDLHRVLTSVARDHNRTLSQTVTDLLRRAVMPTQRSAPRVDPRTGLLVVRVGRVVTDEDVRALEDEA
jgi:predicted transcriptional regulator